jgi:hypothetical protein
VSVEEKARRLEDFLRANPALANVPFIMVAGRPVTPSEALYMLRAGVNVWEVMAGLWALGLDLPWELAEAFYERLVAARPDITIFAIGYLPAMSPAEALEHIRRRDEVGEYLVRAYASLLEFIRARIDA